MTTPIGFLIAEDFLNGSLHSTLRPAFVMIKAGNCKYCRQCEPLFRQLADLMPNIRFFLMRPYDGTDPRERALQNVLFNIVETDDFGFPTFVYFAPDGKKTVHVGSMSIQDMAEFIRRANAAPPLTAEEPISFRPYNV